MPIIRKARWCCCEFKYAGDVRDVVGVEVVIAANGSASNASAEVFGYTLSASAQAILKFCPACGTGIPTYESIATYEGLTRE
jgi:hypothetical protein